ncbi:MAG: ribonuclease HII [Proteobacteria bacterium]|nr:ribonuclease HII [Pseudomonadota bacterium]
MERDLWLFESKAIEKGFSYIAGIDEAGRGPLAGPVVSAAVLLHPSFHDPDITDSKKLTPKKRSYLYEKLYDQAVSIGIGIVDNTEIDRINILNASLLSMSISVKNLSPQPDYLLIDGAFRISTDLPQEPVIRGDALSISIAAASIIAKHILSLTLPPGLKDSSLARISAISGFTILLSFTIGVVPISSKTLFTNMA